MDETNKTASQESKQNSRTSKPFILLAVAIVALIVGYAAYSGYQHAPPAASQTTTVSYYNSTVNVSIGSSMSFIYDTFVAAAVSASFFAPFFSPLATPGQAVNATYSGYLSLSGPNDTNESIKLNYQALSGAYLINLTTVKAPNPALSLLSFGINGTYYSCFPSLKKCIPRQASLQTSTYFSGGTGAFGLVNATASHPASFSGQGCAYISGTFVSSPSYTPSLPGAFTYCFSPTYSLPVLVSVSAPLGSGTATLYLVATNLSRSTSSGAFKLPYNVS